MHEMSIGYDKRDFINNTQIGRKWGLYWSHVGRSVSQFVGRSGGRSVNWSFDRSVGLFVGRSVCQSICQSAGLSVGLSTGRSVELVTRKIRTISQMLVGFKWNFRELVRTKPCCVCPWQVMICLIVEFWSYDPLLYLLNIVCRQYFSVGRILIELNIF